MAKLHRAGLLADYINETIIKSPFFDCFEKNDIEDFVTFSFEQITKEVFKKEAIYDPSLNYIDDYYWAGLNIMNIMMNLSVPLKRILITMSLKEAVGAFELYHEMHVRKFLDHYLELESQRSVLKVLRNEQGFSIANIAYLTCIKQSLLKLYDASNNALFGASFSNLIKISTLFGVSIDAFKRKSTYAPFSQFILQSKVFRPLLIDAILRYFNVKDGVSYILIDHYIEDKEIRKLLGDYKTIVDLSNPFGVIRMSSNRINRKYLSKAEFYFVYQMTIEKLRAHTDDLIF